MKDRDRNVKTLRLRSASGGEVRNFTILNAMDGGGSVICYEASYDSTHVGVLKEFYPMEGVHTLVRNADGQLVLEADLESERDGFAAAKERFLEPYRMLQEMRVKKRLTGFIPFIEIYYGCDAAGNRVGTAYLWSQDSKKESFDQICQEIHANPTEDAPRKLLRCLHCIENLTQCIAEMHSVGLLHRDIKPSNFGFGKRGEEILAQDVSLFDLDAVCSMYDVPEEEHLESAGFTEPESRTKPSNLLTDIFGIGATLFHAIIVPEDGGCCTYQYRKHYAELESLLDRSALIQAVSETVHPYLKTCLLTLLQKTLCLRDERYQSCDDLLADLKQAIACIVPREIMEHGNWAKEMAKKRSQPLNSRKAVLALQYHLFKDPLYARMDKKDKDKPQIDLLIIGFGFYGQKFLDVALQAAQMPGKTLHATVLSASPQDKAVYLKARPELDQFFNIDGSLPNDPASYGTVDFIVQELPTNQPEAYTAFLAQTYADGNPDYIFVATGRDAHNLDIAKSLRTSCPVHIAWDGIPLQRVPRNVIPLYLREDITKTEDYAELDRMGFNVHLIWERNFDAGFDTLRKRYKESYNNVSSLSFALSIKYKLYGVGIDLKTCSLKDAARQYQELADKEKKKRKDKRKSVKASEPSIDLDALICMEHRRWVTEKLCEGYCRITDLDECAAGNTKDKQKKRHICLVRSSPKRSLNGMSWADKKEQASEETEPKRHKWDSCPESEMAALDPLDRVSVELHRMYLRHANAVRRYHMNLLHGDMVVSIQNALASDRRSLAAFQELLTCMKDLWNEQREQVKRFKGLYKAFEDRLDKSEQDGKLSTATRDHVKTQLKELHDIFYPVYASQMYHSYKEEDVALVEGIPFILTYSHKIQLVVPFTIGSTSERFSNLAAATAINPARIVYVDFCQEPKRLQEIQMSLPYLSSYMEKKHMQAEVEFLLGVPKKLVDKGKVKTEEVLGTAFAACMHGRAVKVKYIDANDRRGYVKKLKNSLNQRAKGKDPLLLEQNQTVLSGVMEGMGIFDQFSSYAYDALRMHFNVLHDCDLVMHLRTKPFLTVTDLFALRKTSSTTSNKPEFYAEYRDLWDLYYKYTGAWKFMCRKFKEHAEQADILASFNVETKQEQAAVVFERTIPAAFGEAVNEILDGLVKHKVITEDSFALSKTTHSCQVRIWSYYSLADEFQKLFTDITILQKKYIHFKKDAKNHVVHLLCSQLNMVDVDCGTMEPNGYELMEKLKEMGFLLQLDARPDQYLASFTFVSHQVKELLTTEGRMLEIYVYHKARESGLFDDIRCGFEIDWEQSGSTNEFDCVLTKGYSTIFVECKATRELATEFYTKLSSLVRQCGINAIAVVVGDTQDTKYSAGKNRTMREHGKDFEVLTISERSEIADIGNTLHKLLKQAAE